MGDIRSRAAFASLLCRSSVLYCSRKLVARLRWHHAHPIGWDGARPAIAASDLTAAVPVPRADRSHQVVA